MSSKGKLNAGYLELHYGCEICGCPRTKGNHDKCSKARQQKHTRRNSHDSETVA
ncbi:hypothetical protein QE391_003155 [Pseudomonas fluorescens]|nr:hypothetical protein [Pseudomonas fluorescens]